ncbi:MAG: tripartite tricarboxylate transporter permease [Spirochaetia bacterium]|jgi:putative tricarboxylic transport membrane protein|nr:tripartite tricarboxylate transporter permease [Spirochaetia bacterium]
MGNFIIGLHTVMNAPALLLMIMGVVIGIIFGAIPGLSATMAIALFLPVTYGLSAQLSVVLLIALYVGGISGGLISAILTHIPGTPSSIATCFDGWPLTKKGLGSKALGVGIVFSFLGTVFSGIVLMFLSPVLAKVAIKFGAYEYFALGVFSLTMISGLSGKSVIKGVASALFGCIFATVGMDQISAVPRFTYGIQSLKMGFNILPVMIGMFAVSEILKAAEQSRHPVKSLPVHVNIKDIKGFGFSLKEFRSQIKNFFYASSIGTGIGILPGIGGGIANVIAYSAIKNKSKYPEKFGTGIIDGVVASEASNNAAIGGALVPLLTLGIPGDTVTAMLLGGLTLHGISPGPLMFTQNVDVVYGIFVALIVAAILMLIVEFYGLRIFSQVLNVPKNVLLPAIFIFCVVGAYGVNNQLFDVVSVLIFGALGYVFYKLEIPSAPFILGFIIGPIVEVNLRRGLMFSQGSYVPFVTSPIAAIFLIASVGSLVFAITKNLKTKRN